MSLMGRKIVAIRAYVVEGGGADYHDQGEEHWSHSDEYLSRV